MSTTKTVQSAKSQKATEAKKASIAVKQILKPNAGTRIKRFENFQKLASRFQKLEEKKDELDSFNVASDGLNEKMILQSGEQSFEISNSQVILKLKLEIESTLIQLLDKAEKEIIEYDV